MGLWEEIREEMRLYKTNKLLEVMNKAHAIEENNLGVAKAVGDNKDTGRGIGVFLFKEEQSNE